LGGQDLEQTRKTCGHGDMGQQPACIMGAQLVGSLLRTYHIAPGKDKGS